MEIRPASIDQLRQSKGGRWVAIEADVGSFAQQIKEIADDRGIELALRVSEITGVFKVVQTLPDGREQLVTSAEKLDGRLLETLRRVTSPTYDLAAELEKLEAEDRARHESEQRERVGVIGEKLAHALRKDLGEEKVSVIVPRAVGD